MNYLLKFLKDESGATAIEYGLIAAGISVAHDLHQRSDRAQISGRYFSVMREAPVTAGAFSLFSGLRANGTATRAD